MILLLPSHWYIFMHQHHVYLVPHHPLLLCDLAAPKFHADGVVVLILTFVLFIYPVNVRLHSMSSPSHYSLSTHSNHRNISLYLNIHLESLPQKIRSNNFATALKANFGNHTDPKIKPENAIYEYI